MKSANDLIRIRKLIWVYFVLLIVEGALRKWVAPSLSSPLLLIRDPFVIAIYVLAHRNGLFPRNAFTLYGSLLALLMLAVGVCGERASLPVAIYGLRTDFLHLPLIFIIGKTWTAKDVQKVGRWILIISIPMALLMLAQYRASPTSWLNAGAGGAQGLQLDSAGGHVRASGLFSFISGPIYFFPMVLVFLFYGQLTRGKYPLWLLLASTLALLVGTAASGSRFLLVNMGLVTLCAFLCSLIIQPSLMFRWIWAGALVLCLGFVTQDISFFHDSWGTFSERLYRARTAEGGNTGFVNRGFGEYITGLSMVYEAPLIGYGLGVGTNVGSSLLTGKVLFLLAETEWSRVVLESGPIFGTLFILFRALLMLWIGRVALHCALKGNTLPILIFGTCALNILNGQWGQATTQGFAIFAGGICLAATRVPVSTRARARTNASRFARPSSTFVPQPRAKEPSSPLPTT